MKREVANKLIINQMTLGPIQANCFVLGCEQTKEAVVIDPGDEAERVLISLSKDCLTLKYIIHTHGHFDHVGANKKLKEITGADIMIHELDKNLLKISAASALAWGIEANDISEADKFLNDQDIITFGKYKLKVIHTPGHTQGGVSLYTEYINDQNNRKKIVFVGDTLFAGSIGRTDLPGGNFDTLISSIKNKLFNLGDDVTVYPGHMSSTSIGLEKTTNPFCKTST